MKEPLTHRLQSLVKTPHMQKFPVCRLIVTDALACLSTIAAHLDGREWDSETAESIAETLRQYGQDIRDPGFIGDEPAAAQKQTVMACGKCGSSNVLRDAVAKWDLAVHDWVLVDVHDCASCGDCEAEGDNILVELERIHHDR